ncbi:DUF2971 domain-containing protein [Mucilaginibacter terrigena]|uniref:DUF2971 domain-containing protein n=1 Tax=Mucilaginibacter terrigena TaxID=2492395 RepID=A0A4Q5LIP1_9SPHI|nr:DUF2971 domain-containing protein [Mucilaginibacter terrigena]RYU87957.1 DUF2971 domain-containing protein [Mucilaginibacter terrigena]
MNRKSATPYIDNIVEKYLKSAKEFYPSLEFGSRRSWYSGDEPLFCKFEFRLNSFNLNKTEYQTKRNYDLIHYSSSVQNIIEIINSGYLRLSNLIALNDPQEVSFLVKNLQMKFTNDQIDGYKNHFFTASFCKVTNKNRPDNFPMWRLYGGDGLGAAIVFEVTNPIDEWSNFLLANVQYGSCKSVERFRDFMTFHEEFQKEHSSVIQNFPKALSSLMALHKNKIWEHEKEVRLLTHHEFDQYTLKESTHHICNLKHSIAKSGINYAYVELPLFKSSEYIRIEKAISPTVLKSLIPILKIKKVILGYKNSYDTLMDFQSITNFLYPQYNHYIPVQISHLNEQMSNPT